MYKPKLTINLAKLRHNISHEVKLLKQAGVELMVVNKLFNGSPLTARVAVEAGAQVIAESRVYNLQKIAGIAPQTCLLRIPCLSEIPEIIRYADISLNSEQIVLQALSDEACRQKRLHQILLMVDMGDTREGIWFEKYDELREKVQLINMLPNLVLYGIGSNFNCYGTVVPTEHNGQALVQLVRRLEKDLNILIPRISAGNSTSYNLLYQNVWPEGLNHLRVGTLHEFGQEFISGDYLAGFYHSAQLATQGCSDLYQLEAEIVEINVKPTLPVGELGFDAFLRKKEFQDRGARRRAILAFGRQDVPEENCVPMQQGVQILGQSSDHTIVDIEDYPDVLRIGDRLTFELQYLGVLLAVQSPGVEVCYIDPKL